MPKLSICVVGASAGASPALQTLVGDLPRDFGAAVLIVQHTAIDAPGLLAGILQSKAVLPVTFAKDNETIAAGHVYVAPPNRHLVVEGPVMRLLFGPRINFARPAIDPLFRSIAREYGPRAIGIILTGKLDDGTAGALAIQHCRGKVIVQNPQEAPSPGMPRSVLEHLRPDEVLDAAQIGKAMIKLLSAESDVGSSIADAADQIKRAISQDMQQQISERMHGKLATFTCPECGGNLWQLEEKPPSFACHVGHIVSGENLLNGKTESTERSVWVTMRLLKEVQLLARQLANHAADQGNHKAASIFDTKALLAERQLEHFEQVILRPPGSDAT